MVLFIMSVKKETYFATVQKTERSTKKKRHLEKNNKSVHLLSHVKLFAISLTAAHQASLSITNSQSPPIPMSIELVMPSNISSSVVPFSSCLQSFPASGSFPLSQFFASGGPSIGVSASACPSSEYSGLISFRMDWLDLPAV